MIELLIILLVVWCLVDISRRLGKIHNELVFTNSLLHQANIYQEQMRPRPVAPRPESVGLQLHDLPPPPPQ